ncbi:acyltransferase family protein [Actinocorallia populi]|uniref:acyltransferase family protein n=1 Tax=Actinocorallia populi TaxID=2079200 RepID=UPI0013002B33|nr:acyltransferase [Actinocorallia populi]
MSQVTMRPPSDAPSGSAVPREPARLGWLDLLRGIAALMVALQHAMYYYTPAAWTQMSRWIDPGKYGVLLFFLISGYIVPASLERRGSVRGFWIGRLLRIYPLLLTVCALLLVPLALGWWEPRAEVEGMDPLLGTVAHLTMLQDLVAVPNLLNVLWTLSYEMVFYLLVVALFVTGAHRRSAEIALGFAVAAVLLGGLLPRALLSESFGTGPVVAAVAAVLVAALAASVSGRPALARWGAVAGGALGLVLLLVNGRPGAWETLSIFAVMFLGTAIYRVEQGQISRRTAAWAAALVFGCTVASGLLNAGQWLSGSEAAGLRLIWTGSLVLAALSFWAGRRLRHRRVPRALTGLGTISFSLYLVHPVLLMAAEALLGEAGPQRWGGLAVFTLVLVAVSWASYRCVEAPFQRLGRDLVRRQAARGRAG